MAQAPWFVYLIECRNGAIYTGITPDVAARYTAHVQGKGAKYTRANPPVRLLAARAFASRGEAASMECAIKRLTPAAKREMAEHWNNNQPREN